MHLIVTRPQPDAEELQRKLEVKGHRVSVAPLLDIRMGPQRAIASRGYQAVLITSANGARALVDHPAREKLAGKLAYVVGPQSRAAALGVGFREVVQAGGNAREVVARVQQDLKPDRGPLLYLSGEETSGDLEAGLTKSEFEVDRVIMYAAVPAANLPAPIAILIRRRAADGVLLYSRRTAKVWCKCVALANLEFYMDDFTHFCLSVAVANAIPSGWRLKTAALPTEQAMFDLIENVASEKIQEANHGK
jgi:uroporphyrinogen-III synthase